jgi:hypothetical protein
MGTLNSFASSVQNALVSRFALVLSREVSVINELTAGVIFKRIRDLPTTTDFLASRNSRATFRHFGRWPSQFPSRK